MPPQTPGRVVCSMQMPKDGIHRATVAGGTPKFELREAWLVAAVEELRTHVFGGTEFDPGVVLLSTGFPHARGLARSKQVIGECWDPGYTPGGSCAPAGGAQILLSPVVHDSVFALDVLIHELAHAAVGTRHGHRGDYIKAAKALGLQKPWSTASAGPGLVEILRGIARELGPYPHPGFEQPKEVQTDPTSEKPRSNRHRKCVCAKCGHSVVRMSKKQLAEGGVLCGRWTTPMQGPGAPRCLGECVEVEEGSPKQKEAA